MPVRLVDVLLSGLHPEIRIVLLKGDIEPRAIVGQYRITHWAGPFSLQNAREVLSWRSLAIASKLGPEAGGASLSEVEFDVEINPAEVLLQYWCAQDLWEKALGLTERIRAEEKAALGNGEHQS